MSREEKVNLLVSLIEQMSQEDREATISLVKSKIETRGRQEAQKGEN